MNLQPEPSSRIPSRVLLAGMELPPTPANLLAGEIDDQIKSFPPADQIAWLKTTLAELLSDQEIPPGLANSLAHALGALTQNPPKDWPGFQPTFRQILGASPAEAPIPEPGAPPQVLAGVGTPSFKSILGGRELTPECVADAPWRLEPDKDEIPLTFLIRDGDLGGVKLDDIWVFRANRNWQIGNKPVLRLSDFQEAPGSLPAQLKTAFWTHRSVTGKQPLVLSLSALPRPPARGKVVRLVVQFRGAWKGGAESLESLEWGQQQMQVYLAKEPLPLRDTSCWFYGDTHTHSEFTMDLKEFGSPIRDMVEAGACIGLDWTIITDHSVDLENANPYVGPGRSPWAELGQQSGYYPPQHFRILRGQEVSVKSAPRAWLLGKSQILHLLVFGAPRMIPGAMWEKEPFYTRVLLGELDRRFHEEIEPALVGPIHKLPDVLSGSLGELSVQAQGGLAFAAHPSSLAQDDGGKWENRDDAVLRLHGHGMEAWNTQARFKSRNSEFSPFQDWETGEEWDGSENDKGLQQWERSLQKKVQAWQPGPEPPRFVLLAGTDAHGSFNYTVGWDIDWDFMTANDNALGKVRTLLYFPNLENAHPRQVPGEPEILQALQSGSAVVTDGPVVTLAIRHGHRRAHLGELLVIDALDGSNDPLQIDLRFVSSREFGRRPQNLLLHTYFDLRRAELRLDQQASAAWEIPFKPGAALEMTGGIPEGIGYLRASVETQSQAPFEVDHRPATQAFRCYTNPIFVYNRSGKKLNIRIHFLA